ncbi:MAG: 23S rRNA (pseudouridine(1915)-N(3))-methyltransferase RlmH [Alphaproteobacteria bacterium]|mgnify:FL=1|nr:23S rRNA (pseudouridine(1915)-N(3))-methyltransferase RlmH [Alphaproteobacteria bacterium]
MDIIIACIGHMKPSPELDLLSKYIKQTRWNVVVREFEDKKPGSVEERKKREGALLLSAVPAAAKIVVMDERGKLLSSEKFAKRLGDWQDESVPAVVFLIGGADGHSEEIRKKADLVLAFGEMTWPHMLARVMLAEQIYRAKTILDGHPYHRA